MSNWQLLPPSGGSNGPKGGPLEARQPKILRPIPVIDVEESDNDSTSRVRKFLESILTFLWGYRKTVMGGVAILVLLYVVLKLVLGFFAMVGGVYQEIVGYGNSLNANFWQYMKYPLLIGAVLLAMLFAISRYKASSLGGGTENTGRTVMHGIYSMWRPARNAIIFCAVCFGFWIGVVRIVQEAEHYKQGHDLVSRSINTTTKVMREVRMVETIPQGPDADTVIEFFEASGLDNYRKRVMIVTCGLESGYRQFEEDGKTPLQGREVKEDTGVCQINRNQWGGKAKELGYNIDELNGNLRMALWIVNNDSRSIRNWTLSLEAELFVQSRGVTIDVPVGKWSYPITLMVDIPGTFRGTPSGEMKVRDERGMEYILSPTQSPEGLYPQTLQYTTSGSPKSLRFKWTPS